MAVLLRLGDSPAPASIGHARLTFDGFLRLGDVGHVGDDDLVRSRSGARGLIHQWRPGRWARQHVHLVFHNGALLNDTTGLLAGDYPDRRMLYFKDMADVRAKQAALVKFIRTWIKLMDAQSTSA